MVFDGLAAPRFFTDRDLCSNGQSMEMQLLWSEKKTKIYVLLVRGAQIHGKTESIRDRELAESLQHLSPLCKRSIFLFLHFSRVDDNLQLEVTIFRVTNRFIKDGICSEGVNQLIGRPKASLWRLVIELALETNSTQPVFSGRGNVLVVPGVQTDGFFRDDDSVARKTVRFDAQIPHRSSFYGPEVSGMLIS